jgi:hypothetical protein
MKGTIYLLSNSVDDMVYVGSTVNSVRQRLGDHRRNARAHIRNSSLYIHMRKVGISKWIIEAIKICDVNDRRELEKVEFKCISRYPDRLLLNTEKEFGKRSVATRGKCSAALRGGKSDKFKRGSVSELCRKIDDRVTKYIKFQWQHWDNDVCKHKSKTFSIKKYGERGAMKMAEAFRDTIYPKPE